jgi:hypothetical protein
MTNVIDRLAKEVLSLLRVPKHHIDEALAEAFDRLDYEIGRAFARDPARRGAVRRALWAARDIASDSANGRS